MERLGSNVAPRPLSANIYCDHYLDDLLRSAIHQLSQKLRQRKDEEPLLWFSRYAKGGEHLKIRVHVPEEEWPSCREEITESVESIFARLPAMTHDRLSAVALPPIDQEDEVETDYPDRTILWTSFRPSPIICGSAEFLHGQFLCRFYACMSRGSGIVLDWVASEEVNPSAKDRQSMLLKALVAGLRGLALSPADLIHYVSYHRDWLLRYLSVNMAVSSTSAETLGRLDRKLERMEDVVVTLSLLMSQDSSEEYFANRLRPGLHDFFCYVTSFRGQPKYDLDPYTSDAAFLPLFKVLHAFANQIGVPILQELYIYHLLLRSIERTFASR